MSVIKGWGFNPRTKRAAGILGFLLFCAWIMPWVLRFGLIEIGRLFMASPKILCNLPSPDRRHILTAYHEFSWGGGTVVFNLRNSDSALEFGSLDWRDGGFRMPKTDVIRLSDRFPPYGAKWEDAEHLLIFLIHPIEATYSDAYAGDQKIYSMKRDVVDGVQVEFRTIGNSKESPAVQFKDDPIANSGQFQRVIEFAFRRLGFEKRR